MWTAVGVVSAVVLVWLVASVVLAIVLGGVIGRADRHHRAQFQAERDRTEPVPGETDGSADADRSEEHTDRAE